MENTGKLAKALLEAQREMGVAKKDSNNPYYDSKYADLNAIREVCIPVLNKHGVCVLQPTVALDGVDYVQTVLMHENGETFSSMTRIVAKDEKNAQAYGSGISYARRYGLQSLMNVGAEDDDANSAVGEAPKKEAQKVAKEQEKNPGGNGKLKKRGIANNDNFDNEPKEEEKPVEEEKKEEEVPKEEPKVEEPKAEAGGKRKLNRKSVKEEEPKEEKKEETAPVQTEKNPEGEMLFDKLDRIKKEMLEKIKSFKTSADLMKAAPGLVGDYRKEGPSQEDYDIVREAANQKYNELLEAEQGENKKVV